MSKLSPNTRSLVKALFKPQEVMEVGDLLENSVGAELSGYEDCSSMKMERIRFAVLKLASEGAMSVDAAINLANTDWRDLLVSAGFGEDLNAHEKWYRSVVS